AWSFTAFDNSIDDFRAITLLYDALSGEFVSPPLHFGAGSRLLHGALLGGRLIQIGTKCNDRSCYSPATLLRRGDGNPAQPWTEPRALISEAVSGSNPGLVYELESVVVQGDQIRAFWTTRLPERGAPNGTLATILDAAGEFVGQNAELVLARDPRFRARNQITDSFLTARVAPGSVQVYWSVPDPDGQMTQLRVQAFGVSSEAGAGRLTLSGIGECSEPIGWVTPQVTGDTSGLWVRTALGSTPADQIAGGLATVGTSFELLAGEDGAVLEQRHLRGTDLNCPDILEIVATSEPQADGLYAAQVTWDGLPDAIDRIALRINNPSGQLFARSTRKEGTAETGRWVRNGMVFFMVDDDSNSVIAFRVARP
ncbi:MAG: hypothetical protein AAGA95_16280, partial [Pseudomonadota bacterium]